MRNPELWERVKAFAIANEIVIGELTSLGYGNDGEVWKTERVAVKACSRRWNYTQERDCYQRLSDKGVTQLCGLNIPNFENCDDALMVIQMGIVKPPYLLDFGKVYLDTPPDYPEGHELEFEEKLHGMFGDDVPAVKKVLRQLRMLGIYYVDPNPGNIKFRSDDDDGNP